MLLQILKLALLRQPPKPKQVASLFKIGVLGQFMNVNAAIGKNAAVAIDVTNAGVGSNNAFQSFWGRSHARHSLSLNWIDYLLPEPHEGVRGDATLLLYAKTQPGARMGS